MVLQPGPQGRQCTVGRCDPEYINLNAHVTCNQGSNLWRARYLPGVILRARRELKGNRTFNEGGGARRHREIWKGDYDHQIATLSSTLPSQLSSNAMTMQTRTKESYVSTWTHNFSLS